MECQSNFLFAAPVENVPLLELGDLAANLIYDTAELVTENVTLLELNNSAVKQMQVRTADCGSGNLDNDIAGLHDLGLRALDHLDLVLAHPRQRLHLLARRVGVFSRVARVCDILCRGGFTAMTDGLFGLQSSLGHHLGRLLYCL